MKRHCANPAGWNRGGGVRKAAAFTLLELVVVLGIIAIIGAMAIFRPTQSLATQRATAAAQRIITDLSFAQRRALQTSAAVVVQFTPASHEYTLVGFKDPDRPGKMYTIDLTLSPYQSKLARVDFGGRDYFQFDIYGRPSSAGEIEVTSGSLTRTIAVQGESGKALIK